MSSSCNVQALMDAACKAGFRDLVPEADSMAVMNQLLCDINAGGGGGEIVEGLVTNGNTTFYPSGTVTQTASSYRKRYVITSPCTELHIHFAGLTVAGGSVLPLSWSGKVSLQKADGLGNPSGPAIPVTFGGSSTFTLNGDIQRSDSVVISLSAGDVLFVITYNATTSFPSNGYLSPLSGDNIAFGVDATGDPTLFTNDGSQIGVLALAPCLITGKIQKDNKNRCVIGYGDSIMQGFNDSDTTIQRGWLARALGSDFGYVNVGIGGSSAFSIATIPANYVGIYYAAKYCGLAVYNLGFNDFFGGQASAVQVEGWTATIVSQIRAQGVSSIIGCTVLPGTSSTDGWTTAINQTPKPEGGRTQYNSDVLAGFVSSFDAAYDFNGSLALVTNLQKRNPSTAAVVATDTAGAGSVISAIRTSANGVGSTTWAGATLKWTHLGIDYYGQILAYRPSLVGGLNVLFTSGLVGTELISPGDTYVIINSWDGDVGGGGGHPNGYGHTHAAAVAAGTLVPLIETFVPPVPPPPVTAYLPIAGGTMTGAITFAGSQPTATTAAPNIVQLTDSIVSTSTTTAATPNSVKNALAAAVAASGTVTSVSVTTANGVSGTVATATTTPAISLTLGAITPTTVTPSGQFVGNASGVAYTFAGDTTTGITRTAAGSIGLTLSGTVKQFTLGSSGQFNVNSSTGLSSGAQVEVTMDSTAAMIAFGIGYGKAPAYYACGVGGTQGSPTATTTSQVIRFGMQGQDNVTAGTTTYNVGGTIDFTPTGTWTSSDHGCTLALRATPSGATTRVANVLVTGIGVSVSGGIATTPNAASALEVQSTTQGVRFPNMTTTQKTTMANVAGMVVFDTTLGKLCVNSGSGWQTITSV
jgi:hypothetical protein